MKRLLLVACLVGLAACAAASGYDPKRYEGRGDPPKDPDTQPLPSESRKTIPDPRKKPEPKAPAPANSTEPSHTPETQPDASM